jgi:uncharacterized protein YkwD
MNLWQRFRNHFAPHPTNAYRPHLLRRGWLVFFLAAMLMTEGFLVASLVARQSGSSFLAAVVQSEVISMTNDERAQNKVGTLTENSLLDAAARAKAQDMAAKGYFAHVSPDGREPWDFIVAAGYDYQYAGENLAVRFVDSKDVVDAWMASPTHRANITKVQYTDIGIGLAQGTYEGASATYVVEYFGSPAGAVAPTPAPAARALAAAPAPRAENPQVLGASIAPSGPLNTVVRQLPRLVGNPRGSAALVLEGIATLIILVLGLTVVMHVRIQPTDLLLPGAAVAGVALFLLVFNGATLSVGSSQTAAATLSGGGGVVITADGAATSR